jgi:hypothetical protein
MKKKHNWKNETQSVINNFLKNTIYFNVKVKQNELTIVLSKKDGLYNDYGVRLDRSNEVKLQYMQNHNVSYKKGFELHHIVPLSYSTSYEHFRMLDDWKNIIYIDALKHSLVNRHIILSKGDNHDLRLLSYHNDEVYLKDKENVLYAYNKLQLMLDKNRELREIK